jgi:UDPglucose 6-dehydrogenase
MNITCVGAGYVGLVTGACFAELGYQVICADIDKQKIAQLKKGYMPIYELGLEELVRKNVEEGRLSFTDNVGQAIRCAEVVFNGVGTPEDPVTHKADLQYIFAVAETFAKNLSGSYKILVNKSTVPVGTAEKVKALIKKSAKKGTSFDVVSNPEFLREGAAIKDFLNPDRIVVGASSKKAREVMELLYRPLVRSGRPLILTDIRSAETIKYAANAFLALKITFINEVANFCQATGANVKEVAKGMGADNRIGSRFLHAGIGYGGSCFPKDVKAFIETGREFGTPFRIIETVDEVNQVQRRLPFVRLNELFSGDFTNKTIALWGLSFKPRTDDIRESAAIENAKLFLEAGARVRVYDPVAMPHTKKVLQHKNLFYADTDLEATIGADVLILATEWDEFRVIDYTKLKKQMKGSIIFDGRNILERSEAEKAGFSYFGVGV